MGSLAMLLVSAGAILADDASLEALKARLEQLEKHNDELRARLEKVESDSNIVLDEEGQDPGAGPDKKAVQKIVADYLKAADKKKKDDEAAAKKKAETEGVEVGKDTTFKTTFKNGVHFSTGDGAFKAALRGRWQNDYGWAGQDRFINGSTTPFLVDGEQLDDGTIFRRARLGLEGTVWEVVNFVAEFDFTNTPTTATGDPSIGFREVWMGINQLPLIGTIRVGHHKEPFHLEELTSSRYLTFIERSNVDGAFVEAYNPGIIMGNTFLDQRLSLCTSFWKRVPGDSKPESVADGNYAWTSRVTVLPIYEHDGRYLLHLGAAYSMASTIKGENNAVSPPATVGSVRYRARPYRIDAEEFLDVTIFGRRHNSLGLEAAVVFGPLSFQAEYVWDWIEDGFLASNPLTAVPLGTVNQHGWYAFVSYFLTGENRVYSRSAPTPAFTRQIVYEPFYLVRRGEDGCMGLCRGKGAWEIAARIGYVSLNDDGFVVTDPDTAEGGTLWQYTFGVNWYWNPNFKVQWNYEHLLLHQNTGNIGDVDTFVMRFAWDF
jgi:phosphate-selective porin OprO/OprP